MKKILCLLLALIAVFSLAACGQKEIDGFYSKWMSYIEDETLIKQIVIPGSHDAATKGMFFLAETQGESVAKQLEKGVRYLDIRVSKKSNGSLVIFHGPIKGQKFQKVVEQITDFISKNTTETLILDFQHFEGGSQKAVADVIEANWSEYLIKKEDEKSGAEFIDNLTLSACRGKLLIFWGSGEEAEREWAMRRNNDGGTLADTLLESYYDGEEHKQGSVNLIEHLSGYIQKYKEKDSGLFVLQGQLTAPKLLVSPKSLERKHAENMTRYVKELKDSPHLAYINIIMRDYITKGKEKIDGILYLNVCKGNVKKNAEEEFLLLTQNPQ